VFNVIFEVQPEPGCFDAYLKLAAHLKPALEAIDGFIDNERFGSIIHEGRVLSLSTWRDEKSLVRWRTHGEHHDVQQRGRGEVFEDYHLRIGEVTFDSDALPGVTLPQQRLDETQAGSAKFVSLTEVTPGQVDGDSSPARLLERLAPPLSHTDLVGFDFFESIHNRGKACLLLSWKTAAAAGLWSPDPQGIAAMRHRVVRVIRDYGMHDRREAPQYYPEAPATASTPVAGARSSGP
jgi:heme-degrading monooxygenase HmoA